MNKSVKKGLAVALGVAVVAVGVSGLRLKDIEDKSLKSYLESTNVVIYETVSPKLVRGKTDLGEKSTALESVYRETPLYSGSSISKLKYISIKNGFSYNKDIGEFRDGVIQFQESEINRFISKGEVIDKGSYYIISEGSEIVERYERVLNDFINVLPEEVGKPLVELEDFDILDTTRIIVSVITPSVEQIRLTLSDKYEIRTHVN